MEKIRLMRLLVLFDIPMKTKAELREYRQFTKYLKSEGFIRIQYSVYAKLCINSDAASTASKRLKRNSPVKGDIRYLILSEMQYQNIVNIHEGYSLQEQITTIDRTLMIGGMNDESYQG